MNVDAYPLSARTFPSGNSAELPFADYAAKSLGAWWTNKRMPATSNTIARGIVYRMGRMGLRTACHPTWGTVAIDDIYTSSRAGTRHFSPSMRWSATRLLIVQPDAYDPVEFKVV